MACARCEEYFTETDTVLSVKGDTFHEDCFACYICLRPLYDDEYFMFDDNIYCKEDYVTLVASRCAGCGEFHEECRQVTKSGTVLSTGKLKFHSTCYNCHACKVDLRTPGVGVVVDNNAAYCKRCNEHIRLPVCEQCSLPVEPDDLIVLPRGRFHSYHLKCDTCKGPLHKIFHVKHDKVFCFPCVREMKEVQICGGCHGVIDGIGVEGLGKHWHHEHLTCAVCDTPFGNQRFFVHSNLAYCEAHFLQRVAERCCICRALPTLNMISALNKTWCTDHFRCAYCDTALSIDKTFHEVDAQPVCNACFEYLPKEFRTRLCKLHHHYS